MPYCSVDGLAVTEARISLPRVGVWQALLRLEKDGTPSGRVTIDLDGLKFSGTVQRSGAWAGSAMLRVVGGAAAMATPVPAKAYRNTTARLPVTDILAAVGEDFDALSDSAMLSRTLPFWIMREESAAKALTRLLDDVPDAVWRVRPNGAVWVGTDSFPVVKLNGAQVVEQDSVNRRVTLSAQPTLLPGVTWGGERVSYVEHQLGSSQLRSLVGFEL
jgi:hypothetical protein